MSTETDIIEVEVKQGPGRPRTVVTDEEMAQAEQYAYNGCKNRTIATLMGWDKHLIDDREDIRAKLTKKRAESQADLRQAQRNTALISKNAIMQIFLGKNELDQTDKTESTVKHQFELLPPVIQRHDALPDGHVQLPQAQPNPALKHVESQEKVVVSLSNQEDNSPSGCSNGCSDEAES